MARTSTVPDTRAPGFARAAGHFGELLQGRLGPMGPVVLVTLPCPVLFATARLHASPPGLYQPGGQVLDWARVIRFLSLLGIKPGGRTALRVDMPPGGGAGASTASLVAIARAHGAAEHRIAAACLAVEGASDPLMLRSPGQVLWASRQGRVVAPLPALPRMEVLGGFCGPSQRTDPADVRFPDISDLVQDWRAAAGDLPRVAALASQSARRTLACRGPDGDGTEALSRQLGALGFAIAHTGSARALLFGPGGVPSKAADVLRAAGWRRITQFRVGGHDDA